LVLASLSRSFISRRNLSRQSVTVKVKRMQATMAKKVAMAKLAS
jgi:hypothetical protein